MPMSMTSPTALDFFLETHGHSAVFMQVHILRVSTEFELRHILDVDVDKDSLEVTEVAELRRIAQHEASGAFRPLRSAPNLRNGWRCLIRTRQELELALHHLYPGALADWFAWQRDAQSAADYRAFAGRQTGMYRINATLSETTLGWVAASQCASRFCLKRRVWTSSGLPAEDSAKKSSIPCLEPCPLLMEFARVAAREEQANRLALNLSEWEFETLKDSLGPRNPESSPSANRTADLGDPGNPRRREFLLEKLSSLWNRSEGFSCESQPS